MLRFDRIGHLLSPDAIRDKRVVQVGVGSGGAPVNDHLTMNGVRRWILFDPDVYEEVNLVRHPRRRSDIGRLKVECQRDWILDRNPGAEVEIFAEDVLSAPNFRDAVAGADLLLCCPDKQAVRLFVNTVAVEKKCACITASVYRQGFGGESYSYVPSVTGCFACMQRIAAEQGWNTEEPVQPLPIEQDAIYGLNLRDYRASGLSMDIDAIAIIQARMALDTLLRGTERRFSPLPANWVIFYNRRIPNAASSGFLKGVHCSVKPRVDCLCGVP